MYTSRYNGIDLDFIYSIVTLKDIKDFHTHSFTKSTYVRLAEFIHNCFNDFDFRNNDVFRSTLEPLYYFCRDKIHAMDTATGHKRMTIEHSIMKSAEKLAKTKITDGLYFLTTSDYSGAVYRARKLDQNFYYDLRKAIL